MLMIIVCNYIPRQWSFVCNHWTFETYGAAGIILPLAGGNFWWYTFMPIAVKHWMPQVVYLIINKRKTKCHCKTQWWRENGSMLSLSRDWAIEQMCIRAAHMFRIDERNQLHTCSIFISRFFLHYSLSIEYERTSNVYVVMMSMNNQYCAKKKKKSNSSFKENSLGRTMSVEQPLCRSRFSMLAWLQSLRRFDQMSMRENN